MRRDDFLFTDDRLFQQVAERCRAGYLSLVTADGYPRSVALNFVAVGKALYFHGALAGEKFDIISGKAPVGFSMVWELSYIPSNWIGPDFACPATQLFKSVEIKGQCTVVTEVPEKVLGLQALMEKYQPEGQFKPFSTDEKIYKKAIQEVGVFRVNAESWTSKVRLYQEKPMGFQDKIIGKLEKRGLLVDGETIIEMNWHRTMMKE